MPQYEAETEKALADALGVYDLADGYKAERVITLPSEPLALAESPDGRNGAAVYAWKLAVLIWRQGRYGQNFQSKNLLCRRCIF